MQFIGRYYHALEQKGRLSIPALFRQQLGEGATVTQGLDGCLFMFPPEQWVKISAKASELPFTQKAAREWIRLLAHNATAVQFDKLGRIRLPDYLIDQAKLKKQVVIAGSLSHIEIWDQNTYHQNLDDLNSRAEAIAEQVGTLTQQ